MLQSTLLVLSIQGRSSVRILLIGLGVCCWFRVVKVRSGIFSYRGDE